MTVDLPLGVVVGLLALVGYVVLVRVVLPRFGVNVG
jgi:hypothetical protein